MQNSFTNQKLSKSLFLLSVSLNREAFVCLVSPSSRLHGFSRACLEIPNPEAGMRFGGGCERDGMSISAIFSPEKTAYPEKRMPAEGPGTCSREV